jgi:DNA-binding transcriptional MerR regulator
MEGFTSHQASRLTGCTPRQLRYWDQVGLVKLDKQLSEVRLVTDGQSIFKISRKRDEILDALRHGQMAFFVAIDDIARGVSDNVAQFRADRERFIRALEDAKREVQDESVRMAAAGRGRPLHGAGRGATAGARAAFARPAPGLFHPPTR